ncbi:MAG: helix-turn-helix domain-containing protein [Candidatus Eremiobacteraeota bacterium]|nr:helix-turn-helix domain-containing protein [Candidatus Eremiobacteraeota bacterium]
MHPTPDRSDDERRRRLGDFLKRKRSSIAPSAFDLPVSRRRRVAGLRREEVALLAGISVAWYTQLESGAEITVSPALLRRIADVLGLSRLERAYLFTLAIDEMGVVNAVVPELELLSCPRIAGETFEDEIAMVLRAHRGLKTQIYSALVHGTLDDLLPNLDESRCPIGLWLHDDLAPAMRGTPQYTRAARLHAAFHREIDKVVRIGTCGESRPVELLLAAPSRYVLASAALERAFAHWAARAR